MLVKKDYVSTKMVLSTFRDLLYLKTPTSKVAKIILCFFILTLCLVSKTSCAFYWQTHYKSVFDELEKAEFNWNESSDDLGYYTRVVETISFLKVSHTLFCTIKRSFGDNELNLSHCCEFIAFKF